MIGALLGAAGSLIGGLMGKKSAEKQAAQNIKLQKQFAQQGIQWKVKDAEAAGVHPLYALGAQTHSFSPVTVGDPLGGAIADMGQNLGRAFDSGRTSNERISHRMSGLAIQRAELENQKLATEIALLQQPGTPPPPHTENAVIPGQGNGVKSIPHEVTATAVPGITAGAPADTTLYQTPKGYAPGMSEVFAEGAGEGAVGQTMWALRNYLPPVFGQYHKGLPEPREGYMWIFNPFGMEYVETPRPNWHDKRRSN